MEYLKSKLTAKRFKHVIGTAKCAVKLAKRYNVDACAAKTAALLHDMAKTLDDETQLRCARDHGYTPDEIHLYRPDLLHGINAAFMAQDMFGIEDEDTLNAIRYHTTGRPAMSKLEKIIYISDLIEETRDFDGVEMFRKLANKDLDEALIASMLWVIKYILEKQVPLHPDGINALNYYLLNKEDIKCKKTSASTH